MKNETPTVSVVMGVYNHPERLPETLESVLVQTETDWELIIVNDGSTDPGVEAVLNDFAASDPRARIITKQNEGLTRALIDGCLAARGTYIARIDAGDVMLPERLEIQRVYLDANPQVVFVSCWTDVCGPEWEFLYGREEQTKPCGEDICPNERDTYVHVGPSHHGSVMFRRSTYCAVGGYCAAFYYGQDWDLWYRLAEQGFFAIIPECLHRARLFPKGISGQHRLRQEEIGRHALAAHWCRRQGHSEASVLSQAACIRPSSLSAELASPRGEGAHHIAELLRRQGDLRCRRYFMQALRENPLHLKSLCRLAQSFLLKNSFSG